MQEEIKGYHFDNIVKGEYGKSSKLLEEVLELIDSEKQNSKIMCLLELSDLIGAIDGYLKSNYKEITLQDLIIMSNATQRSFYSGERSGN